MVRWIGGIMLPVLAAMVLAGVGGRAEAATNTLDKVSSDFQSGNYYKCKYEGHVTTTDPDSRVGYDTMWFVGDPDDFMEDSGYASPPDPADPTFWAYAGWSTHYWQSGYSTTVYTISTVRDPQGNVTYPKSNSLTWTSGS